MTSMALSESGACCCPAVPAYAEKDSTAMKASIAAAFLPNKLEIGLHNIVIVLIEVINNAGLFCILFSVYIHIIQCITQQQTGCGKLQSYIKLFIFSNLSKYFINHVSAILKVCSPTKLYFFWIKN